MEISIRSADDRTVVVTPSGEIDFDSVTIFRRELEVALALAPRRLVIDLSGVTFIDSGGAAALVAAWHWSGQVGTSFGIARPSEAVARTLMKMGLAGFLPRAEDP